MGDGVLMAGAGKKTFSAGETLLASDVNSYLMDQAVMVFDDAAARTSAIGSPSEGMVTYLKDVDLVQVWDGSEWNEISGGGSITVSSTAPSAPEAGDLWFYSDTGQTFVYYTDVDGSQWVEIGQVGGLAAATVVTSSTRPSNPIAGQVIFETDTGLTFIWDGSAWQSAGGGGSIEISATAPSSPSDGDLWWDSDNGNLYIYYDDGDSQQWVAANGPQVFVGTSAPAGYQGQLWFDSTDGKTYIYYDDGTSAQWVSAIGGSLSGNVIQVVSTTKTDTFSASTAGNSFTGDVTGLTASITPSSTSSKIYISVSLGASRGDGVGFTVAKLLRDGTDIIVGDAASSRAQVSGQSTFISSSGVMSALGLSGVDEPATTSSVTYSVRLYNTSSTTETIYVNRTSSDNDNATVVRAASTITVMEIAG